MFTAEQYELIAFSQGRKWENFGGVVVERETPSVPCSDSRNSNLKKIQSNLIFRVGNNENQKGTWFPSQGLKSSAGNRRGSTGLISNNWKVQHRNKIFQLKQTPSGQVGLFPEQAANWEWIETISESLTGLKGINLFGYTGGTTLSLASRGVEMVHIDAAESVVKWARQNAALSGLEQSPIRWITEDAVRFVNREIKRGSRYDIIVLDPPTFGRGPKGEQWKIDEHLEPLLALLAELCRDRLKMLVLTCHTSGFEAPLLLRLARSTFDLSEGVVDAMPMELTTRNEQLLQAGHCVRFFKKSTQT